LLQGVHVGVWAAHGPQAPILMIERALRKASRALGLRLPRPVPVSGAMHAGAEVCSHLVHRWGAWAGEAWRGACVEVRGGLTPRVPTRTRPHLQVFLANFLLIVVARPLFFGPTDDTGFAQRNLAVGQAPLFALLGGVRGMMGRD
jgi:hypothetical protein